MDGFDKRNQYAGQQQRRSRQHRRKQRQTRRAHPRDAGYEQSDVDRRQIFIDRRRAVLRKIPDRLLAVCRVRAKVCGKALCGIGRKGKRVGRGVVKQRVDQRIGIRGNVLVGHYVVQRALVEPVQDRHMVEVLPDARAQLGAVGGRHGERLIERRVQHDKAQQRGAEQQRGREAEQQAQHDGADGFSELHLATSVPSRSLQQSTQRSVRRSPLLSRG